jgi:uncharacterized coiled-coil protein SlyX
VNTSAPPPDPVADVLDVASREGALQGEALAAFVDALRERARLVLAGREARLRELEAETAWRRESMASLEAALAALEAELSWRRESMASLDESVRALGEQAEKLTGEWRRASEAHGALLAHHRDVVERVAAELASVASLSPLRAGQARRRLRDLAALLRADSR